MEAGPLQTVLGHLLENAVEARPQGGVVRVFARPGGINGSRRTRVSRKRGGVGGYLQICISDTGPGIKPEVATTPVRRTVFHR